MVNINSSLRKEERNFKSYLREIKKYKITTKSGRSVYLQAVTLIDTATGWIEICIIPSAWADVVANQVELAWLVRYPLPNTVIVDRGNEFLAKLREMIIDDCSIMGKPITSRNPPANAMLERVHQTIGNIPCTFKVQNMVLDKKIHGTAYWPPTCSP